VRVRYGAREELLDLVHLKGIGRARGRALFQAGFADREALRAAPFDRVAAALKSPYLAGLVLEQLNPGRGRVAARTVTAAPAAAPTVTPAAAAATRRRSRRLEEFPGDSEAPASR
jgi:hypothetical protein